MAELANCPKCNALFMRGPATVCKDCVKREEEEFQTVYAFVRQRQNRTATVEDIVRGTGVEEHKIREFVRSKRLHPAQFPSLSYGCEKCGADIREGRLCSNCTEEIQNGIQQQDQLNDIQERNKKKDLGNATYYSMKRDKR
ncbi:TIGR03826 family flagellar region protein [Halobacillus seohaensis]|uniref:TIGR03826 family flagellar region protein n=1 Tax=Halobacillus seohaensis TaxID=447421 RepID=A0ABW2ENP0_9BACI